VKGLARPRMCPPAGCAVRHIATDEQASYVALLNTFSRLCQPIADQIFCGDGGVPARF
jgi:hypothetical protein